MGVGIVVSGIVFVIVFVVICKSFKCWWLWGVLIMMVVSVFGLMVLLVFVVLLFNIYIEMKFGLVCECIVVMVMVNNVFVEYIYVFDVLK